MRVAAEKFITEDDYWLLEEQSETKHEYFNGEIFAMAGGSPEHSVVSGNLITALNIQLRGKSCRVAGSDQKVKVEATGLITYPDVVVYCPPWRFDTRHPNMLLTPALIVEVISPSTMNHDKGAKFDNYRQLPSLQDYLLVPQNKMQVDHYHRLQNGRWHLDTAVGQTGVITLEALGCSLALADLYLNVEPDNQPYPLRASTE